MAMHFDPLRERDRVISAGLKRRTALGMMRMDLDRQGDSSTGGGARVVTANAADPGGEGPDGA